MGCATCWFQGHNFALSRINPLDLMLMAWSDLHGNMRQFNGAAQTNEVIIKASSNPNDCLNMARCSTRRAHKISAVIPRVPATMGATLDWSACGTWHVVMVRFVAAATLELDLHEKSDLNNELTETFHGAAVHGNTVCRLRWKRSV